MQNRRMAFDPEQIRHTLSAIFHEQGKFLLAELLEIARIELTYSHHDFGRDHYVYGLRIPALRFAKLENQLGTISGEIEKMLNRLGVEYEGGEVTGVRIYPELLVGP